MKTRFHVRLSKVKRKYYEIFGDLEAQVEFLKIICLVLCFFLSSALLGAFVLAKRPPIVIRVSEIGKAEVIKDFNSENKVTEIEAVWFSEHFLIDS